MSFERRKFQGEIRQPHGMLPVFKPKSMVSKDVSRWLEQRLGRVKLGHVGTLDPMADGVLPILFGGATRLQDYLLELPKAYEFDVTLGYETTTLDDEGEVVAKAEYPTLTRELIEQACETLRGRIRQVPPLHSALKYKGMPLYKYARSDRGHDVPLDELARSVTVFSLDVDAIDANKISLRAVCSKGTYVRSLARDLAKKLGTLGSVSRIRRTQAAGVSLEQCATLEQLEAAFEAGSQSFESLVIPQSQLTTLLPQFQVAGLDAAKRLRNGQTVTVDPRDFHDRFSPGGWGLRENGAGNRALPLASETVMDFESESTVVFQLDGSPFALGAVSRGLHNLLNLRMKRVLA